MGRLPTLQLMTLKAAHYHELLGMITGYQRPLTATTLRPARDSCEGCHWPAVDHDDKVRTKIHYDADEKNTETRTRLDRAHRQRRGAREGDARHPLAHRPERRVRQRRRAEAHDPLGPDHRQGRQDDDLLRRLEQGRPRGDGPEAEAADGMRRLPQRGRPPVPSTPPTASTTRSRRAASTAAMPSIKARALAIIDKASPLHGPMDEQVPKFKKIIADAAPKGELKPERRRPRSSSRRRCSQILELSEFEAKDLDVEVVPEPRRPQGLPGLLPLPRRQARQREGRGDPAAVHAVPRPSAGHHRRRR